MSAKQERRLQLTPAMKRVTIRNRGRIPVMKQDDSVRAVPVAFATRRTGSKPIVVSRNGNTCVTHRSFLLPFKNTMNFTTTGVPCNPGLTGSFPWLAKLARRYEQYRFTKLRYEFRSVVASSKSGVVMMSFDYDAADEAPVSKAEQSQTVPNSETNVWMNNDLSVTFDPDWKFVRAGTLATNLDIKTYDVGNLWISSAYGDDLVGGELYVEYSVEFRRPTDGPENSGVLAAIMGSPTTPFNSAIRVNGTAYPFTVATANTLRVTAGGEYLCCFAGFGTTITVDVTTPTISSTSTTSSIGFLHGNFSSTKATILFRVRCEVGDVITFPNIGAGGTFTDSKLWVATADYNSLFLS